MTKKYCTFYEAKKNQRKRNFDAKLRSALEISQFSRAKKEAEDLFSILGGFVTPPGSTLVLCHLRIFMPASPNPRINRIRLTVL